MLQNILNKIHKKTYKLNVNYQPLSDPIKIATDYDEGFCYLPKSLLHPDAVVYSFGAGEDIEVEIKLITTYGCEVHIFDPTPRSVKHVEYIKNQIRAGKKATFGAKKKTYEIEEVHLDKIHFHPIGIWKENTTVKFYQPANEKHVSHSITNLQKTDDFIEVSVKTLDTIMQENGHTHVDFLKMDIEGAEFEVIDQLLAANTSFAALYLEFHHPDMSKYKESTQYIGSYIDKLEAAGYVFLSGFQNKYFSCVHTNYLN